MRVDQCVVSVEQRSAGGCLDLAFVFVRKFAAPIAQMTALFAIPSTVAIYAISTNTNDGMLWSIILFLTLSPMVSAMLVASIGPRVFGEKIAIMPTIGRVLRGAIIFLMLMLVVKAALFFGGMCVLPALLLLPAIGYFAEIVMLENSPASKIISRQMSLCGDGGYFRFLWSVLVLGVFWIALSAGILFAIDLVYTTAFNTPVIFGRLISSPDRADAFMTLIMSDARAVTALHLAAWLPFPLIRLAWFFCYLDQRIRSECWDLEVKFRTEAIRLGEAN